MNIKKLNAVATTIRVLTIDSIYRSNSGHPGLPMGCADIGAVLFTKHLNINPKDPNWINRDRFVLSAGHGSMLLYSLLHLSGFKLSLEDLKKFREFNSKTPGHPEYGHTEGVEATTGPLGAGISNAVGMAIAQTQLADRYNRDNIDIIDNFTYVLAGDGCLMEGVSYEAASLAGHLGLGKLILLYDSNSITIEGSTDISTSEDILERFRSMGWHTLEGDGNDLEVIDRLIDEGKKETERPTIIKFNTTIGYGSPNMAGTAKVHGTPLDLEEIIETKRNLGSPEADFYIDKVTKDIFIERNKYWAENYNNWKKSFNSLIDNNSDICSMWKSQFSNELNFTSVEYPKYSIGDNRATRKVGGEVLNSLAKGFISIIGGSADLSPSTNTNLTGLGDYSKLDRLGRNIHFGVREHAMGGIINGLTLYGGFRPFASTFLVFSDYLRPAIRLAALMKIGSIFVFTHDSIYLGKDGPTHQPIEHIESLRAIPNLLVLRPADAKETILAWQMALTNSSGPTAILLSRQDLKVFPRDDKSWKNSYIKGAYIVNDSHNKPDTVLIATGSEVNLALEAKEKSNKNIRVVSISSRELFLKQDTEYIKSIIPDDVRVITIEAGVTSGWRGLTSRSKDSIGIDQFGFSGDPKDITNYLNFNVERILESINY